MAEVFGTVGTAIALVETIWGLVERINRMCDTAKENESLVSDVLVTVLAARGVLELARQCKEAQPGAPGRDELVKQLRLMVKVLEDAENELEVIKQVLDKWSKSRFGTLKRAWQAEGISNRLQAAQKSICNAGNRVQQVITLQTNLQVCFMAQQTQAGIEGIQVSLTEVLAALQQNRDNVQQLQKAVEALLSQQLKRLDFNNEEAAVPALGERLSLQIQEETMALKDGVVAIQVTQDHHSSELKDIKDITRGIADSLVTTAPRKITAFDFGFLKRQTHNFQLAPGQKVLKVPWTEGRFLAAKLRKKSSDAKVELEVAKTLSGCLRVVPVLGYCIVPEEEQGNLHCERILLYEYMHGGDLHHRLHETEQPLDLRLRIRIALDIAEGIRFFHGCQPMVVHRDIRPENVLLGGKARARISGLGCAKMTLSGSSQDGFAGSSAYADQQILFYNSCDTSPSLDVYSFGVVLLELLSNRKVDDRGVHIRDWAKEKLKGGDMDDVPNPEFVEFWVDEGDLLESWELKMVCDLGRLALEMTEPYEQPEEGCDLIMAKAFHDNPYEPRKDMAFYLENLKKHAKKVLGSVND